MVENLISVIVPVYNTGTYLVKCIESIISQDYDHVEVIIVDDGSTDLYTINLCDDLAKKYEVVNVVHKNNGGLSSARNYGVSIAKGNYIAFVDSDDYIEKTTYSDLMLDIQNYNVKMAIGGMVIEFKNKTIQTCSILNNGIYDAVTIMHYFLLGNWHSACTNLYHKSLFTDNSFPEGEINEDYLFNFNIINSIDRISVNNTPFYHYVKHEGSITTGFASLKHLDWIKHTSFVREIVKISKLNLEEEADFQYLFSNIVLSNKALLSIAAGCIEIPSKLYEKTACNLRREKKLLFSNKYLSFKYKFMGLMLAYFSICYKEMVIIFLKLKKWKN